MTGPHVLFLGPSLDHATARGLHPDAIILPPAAMGDLMGAANRYRPHAIGLVDGTFLRNMSVFHKEILYAIDQGVWVLGASSMGALRAAECDAYGMLGVGQIYAQLVSGAIEDDDEVALTHAAAAAGFRPLSDAMVTIRAALAAARECGLLSAEEASELAGRQKARWFPERRLATIVSDATSLGLQPDRSDALRTFLRGFDGDPKRRDAIALIHAMQALPTGPVPVEERPGVEMSAVFQASLARDVVVETGDGLQTTFDQIRRYAVLNDVTFQNAMQRARERLVLCNVSAWIGGPPSDEELALAEQSICDQVGIPWSTFGDFARDNDLDERGRLSLLTYVAHARRMERSWLGRSRMGLVTDQFLHELRLAGTYIETKAASSLQHAAAATVHFTPTPSNHQIYVTAVGLTGWQPPADIAAYIEEHELGSIAEMLASMDSVVRAHHALFGSGLAEVDGSVPILTDSTEPMMTRGA